MPETSRRLTPAEQQDYLDVMRERRRRHEQRRLFTYTPYPKQLEFHGKGLTDRERLLMAANQVGKTWSAAFETAMHLTGRYPEPGQVHYPNTQRFHEVGLAGVDPYPNGWQGFRFDKPIWAWTASTSGVTTRDNPQRLLIGPPAKREEWGTAAIPRADLLVRNGQMDVSMSKGTTDGVDQLLVRHVSGGLSTLQFKSYAQDREDWQGPSIDLVWFDEEPPLDIYMEGLTRTNRTNGITYLTFTPLLGMSQVVRLFISDVDELTAPGARA